MKSERLQAIFEATAFPHTSGSAEDFSKVASVILGMDDIRAEHIPQMEVEYI